MTMLDLDEAFRELERRADAFAHDRVTPTPAGSRWNGSGHLLRNVTAAAAVVVIAGGVAFAAPVLSGRHDAGRRVAGVTVAAAPSSGQLSGSGTASKAAPSSTGSSAPATDVPRTQAELIARFHAILGASATFTVDSAHSSDLLVTGVLTSAAGTRGLFVLALDKGVGLCGAVLTPEHARVESPCPGATTRPDGSRLLVHSDYADGPVNGLMNDATLSRPDGWTISLYTANVAGKYEGAPVLGAAPALTTAKVTDVVTSPLWVEQ